MGRLLKANFFRWFFLTAPCRLYRRGEESGGAVPWIVVCSVILFVAAAGAIGGALSVALGAPFGDGYYVAAMTAFGVIFGCLLYTLAVVAVLHVRQQPIEKYLGRAWMDRPRRWWDH